MRFYEDQQQTSLSRLAGRSYYIPAGVAKYTLLNGTFAFCYHADGDSVDVQQVPCTDSIAVPSTWQNTGYENPNYCNVDYPHPMDPPYVPMVNPVGVYEKTFTVEGIGRTYLVMEGVSSEAEVYLGGYLVGRTQGSHLQAEFDLTDYVVTGENTLRIAVRKWCAGSYLEDQDAFRCNGIFRDIYILERPEGHIVDVDIRTENNELVHVATSPDTAVTLYDGERKLWETVTDEAGHASFRIHNAKLWNAEQPNLYTLQFEKCGEIITQRFGFRTIAISPKNEVLINGTYVKFRGVNHHDSTPHAGWVMTDEEILKDLRLMKELNINTVRTSHYPPSPRFLDYCDEMGFYVVLETDLETHGVQSRNGTYNYSRYYDVEDPVWPCQDPTWRKEYVDRMERAYQRDKNHASIFMWSTGNESGHGDNHIAMIELLREKADGRLIHAEDASRAWEVRKKNLIKAQRDYAVAETLGENEQQAAARLAVAREWYDRAVTDSKRTDVFSNMYAPTERIERWLRGEVNQPIFLCEYAHAMGNGPGGIWDYVELMHKYPNFIGGCIWEWCDHAVDDNGVYRYGGDFNEATHDGNFCCDGMVFADRSLKAGSLEIKAAYAPFRFRYESGQCVIKNLFDFTSLADYQLQCSVSVDGVQVAYQEFCVDIPPHEVGGVPVTFDLPESCSLGAYIQLSLHHKGHCLGSLQQPLPVPVVSAPVGQEPLVPVEEGRYVFVRGEGFSYRFDKYTGLPDSICLDGRELLCKPVALTAYRAPTDNDRKIRAYWCKERGDYRLGENLNVPIGHVYNSTIRENTLSFDLSMAGISRAPFFKGSISYTFFAGGGVEVKLSGSIKETCVWLPRLGLEFAFAGKNLPFSYFGKGPWENYRDMDHFAPVGYYESEAAKEYVPYIRPQEHGNHGEVRKLTIDSLSFYGAEQFEMNVSMYDAKQLDAAEHTDELPESYATHLRIDYKNSGLGSGSCGPELQECYRLAEKSIDFSFAFKPEN